MFREMFTLVNLQQDLIANIAHNVSKSDEYIEKSIDNVQTAKKYSEKASCVSNVDRFEYVRRGV